jgi:hypothetical protein
VFAGPQLHDDFSLAAEVSTFFLQVRWGKMVAQASACDWGFYILDCIGPDPYQGTTCLENNVGQALGLRRPPRPPTPVGPLLAFIF